HKFTRGQRRNLGVAVGERSYVTEMDPVTSTVRLGGPESLKKDQVVVDELALRSGVKLPLQCEAVIRYRGKRAKARISSTSAGTVVEFSEPVVAPSPGQFAVFYDGDRVLGGGLIQGELVRPRLSAPAFHLKAWDVDGGRMRTCVTERLKREALEVRLRFACPHCADFDPEGERCSEGYPNEAHRDPSWNRSEISFCKLFESAG